MQNTKEPNPIIIGFTGKKGSGKTTAARFIEKYYNFPEMTFADGLKQCCKIVFGLTDDQLYGEQKEICDPNWFDYTPRMMMQTVGTELFRKKLSEVMPEIGEDIWVLSLQRKLQKLIQEHGSDTRVVISDVRFQNEVDMIKSMGGYIIRLYRETPWNSDSHESEAGINTLHNVDFEIVNNGSINELKHAIDDMVSHFILNN